MKYRYTKYTGDEFDDLDLEDLVAKLSDLLMSSGFSNPRDTTEEEHTMQALHDAGWLLIVVTNQPDVARGTTPRADVEAINHFLQQSLHIDEFRTCYHDGGDGCDCRKPLPGMLLEAAGRFDIDLETSVMIGDKLVDVEAGAAAGCRSILVRTGYGTEEEQRCRSGVEVFDDLLSAAESLI